MLLNTTTIDSLNLLRMSSLKNRMYYHEKKVFFSNNTGSSFTSFSSVRENQNKFNGLFSLNKQ